MAEIASGSIDLKSLKVAGEPNKYITYISGSGVKIYSSNVNYPYDYILINSNGMKVYKRNTNNTAAIQVAEFSDAATIGKLDSNHIEIDSSGMRIYKGTTSDTNRLGNFSTAGITLGILGADYVTLTSNGLKVYKDDTQVAGFGTAVTLGELSSKHITIDSDSMRLYSGTAATGTRLATFGSTITLGIPNTDFITLDTNGLKVYKDNSQVASFGEAVTIGIPSTARKGSLYIYSNTDTSTNKTDSGLVVRYGSQNDSKAFIGMYQNNAYARFGDTSGGRLYFETDGYPRLRLYNNDRTLVTIFPGNEYREDSNTSSTGCIKLGYSANYDSGLYIHSEVSEGATNETRSHIRNVTGTSLLNIQSGSDSYGSKITLFGQNYDSSSSYGMVHIGCGADNFVWFTSEGIRVNGNTPIGTVVSDSGTYSLASGDSDFTSTSIGPTASSIFGGTWLLIASVTFPSSSTGRRGIRWHSYTSEDGTQGITSSYVTTPAASGGPTRLQTIAVVQPGVMLNRYYRVSAFQNSGSTQTVTVNWRAVRII